VRRLPAILGWLSLIILMIFISGCSPVTNSQVQILSRFETGEYEDQEVSSERIEELRQDIARYTRVVEEKISAAGSIASAYKLLGTEYQRMGMHKLALAAFQGAIEVEPANPGLLYEAAVAAGNWAASAPTAEVGREYYDRSRSYYERILGIDPFHLPSLYGLSVLLSFQYDQNEEAEELIDRYLRARSADTRALFVKARLLAARGETGAAAGVYGDIVGLSQDLREKNQALLNQRALLDSE